MTAKEKDSILKRAEDHGGKNINIGEYPPIVDRQRNKANNK
jgi:hypothetical protein